MVDTLAAFSGRPPDQWLRQNHPARSGQFLRTDGKPLKRFSDFRNKFTDDEIIDVLAATAPHHCMDGWAYLSRALASLLAGDTHAARHLAYYSQLRAALCILNTHGIGVFNGLNFSVDQSRQLHRLDTNRLSSRGVGTHIAAWTLLEMWAAEPNFSRVFLNCIEFRGVPLSDCIDALQPSSLTAPLVSKIIQAWGVDLRLSADEHEWRNVSSYCAHAFNPTTSDFPARLKLLCDVWTCLEPDGSGGYPVLDRHLLRNFLDVMQHEQVKTASQELIWNRQIENLAPQILSLAPVPFLHHSVEPDNHSVISVADNKTPGDVHAMVCRALLLLRTATSIVRTAFVAAGFEPLHDNLSPWFEVIGVARGFWPENNQPDQVGELWDVVADSVSEILQNSSNLTDQFAFVESFSNHTLYLSQTERAGMWGVCA